MPISHFKAEGNRLELHTIVDELIKDANSNEEKVKAILEWFNTSKNNIFNDYFLGKKGVAGIPITPQLKIYFGEPFFGVRTFNDHDSLWVLTSRYGYCGEYGLIFRDMANAAGLNVTKVTCAGEDHVWNEVQIDNQWIIIDSTRVGSASDNGYNVSKDFMEKKVAGDRRTSEGNVSYVEAEFLNGTIIDVTSRYTDTVNVTIFVFDQKMNPVKNSAITILSNNRYDSVNTQKRGIITNETGQCFFSIGGGEYLIQATTSDIIPLFGEKKVSFSENTPYHNLTLNLTQDFSKNPWMVFSLILVIVLVILTILLIVRKKMVYNGEDIGQKIIHVGLVAEKHRREFAVFTLSFFGIWLLNLLRGEPDIVFFASLILFIIPSACLVLSYPLFNRRLISIYIKRRFRNKKIAILNGKIIDTQHLTKDDFSKDYAYSPEDWKTKIEEAGLDAELIPASEKYGKYAIIINPFGGSYIEEDTTNLKTLKKIKKYINDGGVFVNIGDLAFWRSWNSIKRIEGITSPLVPSYALVSKECNLSEFMQNNKILPLTPILSGGSSLIDTWLYRNFGVKTTIHDPPSDPLILTPLKDYLEPIGYKEVEEFRAALNSEREDSTFIALMETPLPENDKQRCYPVAAIHQEIGYLVLFGIVVRKNEEDLNFVISVISSLHNRLRDKGNL